MELCPSCFSTNVACLHCGGTGFVGTIERPAVDLRITRPDLRLFGTEMYPLSASQIPKMILCPWRAAMTYLFTPDDEPGPAADTGSATHAAVASWHEFGHDPAEAIRQMTERMGEFPRADLEEAASMFLNYTRDPRNREAEIALIRGEFALELPVSFTIPASPEDPTQASIVVRGHVDQVRRVDGHLRVFDLKTSKRPGKELLDAHVYQVASYCVGASHLFGEPVHPGALICPRHYRREPPPESSPSGVYFQYPWLFSDARYILMAVRQIVAAIRSGEVWHNGGEHCRWCPAGSPDVCIPRMKSVVDPGTMRIPLPLRVSAPAIPNVDLSPIGFDFR